jgi:uncharacterized protein (UPF0147 family)
MVEKKEMVELLEEINRQGVPKNIRDKIDESIKTIQEMKSTRERISLITSLLDDVANDPNLSFPARTYIWNVISALEEKK